ncbi:MAG: hypothetical protein ACI4P8_02155 [Akkermansia sp.]
MLFYPAPGRGAIFFFVNTPETRYLNKTHRSRGSKKTPSDGIALLPQKEARHHQHMPLKMSAQERNRFPERARMESSRTKGKKAKGAMIDAVVPFVGYQSRKQAIRPLPQASGADSPKKNPCGATH